MGLTAGQYALAIGMLVTGSLNTLSSKFAFSTESEGFYGELVNFNHPWFITIGMFAGETLCLVAFTWSTLGEKRGEYYENLEQEGFPARPFTRFIFALPASLDMVATALQNLGLTMTHASVYQILRGSVIIFTGLLSWLFLGRRVYQSHLLGMTVVAVGLAFVGVSSVMAPSDNDEQASNPGLGMALIVFGQLIAAMQVTVQEKFLSKYNVPPLQAVGWEGLWGFSILASLLAFMYWIPGESAGNHFENSINAVWMLKNSGMLLGSVLIYVVSIAFFNFFGLTITKVLSATHRMVMDSLRTIVVWMVALSVQWQKFDPSQSYDYFQLLGFTLMLLGTLIYNEIVIVPGVANSGGAQVRKESLLAINGDMYSHSTFEDGDEYDPLAPESGATLSGFRRSRDFS